MLYGIGEDIEAGCRVEDAFARLDEDLTRGVLGATMKRPFIVLIPLLVLVLPPSTVLAADAYTEAVALLEAMNARARYKEAMVQLEKQMGVKADSLPSDLGDRIFNEMARIYSEVYTVEELAAIKEFHLSPAGQAFLAKQPLLAEKYIAAFSALATEVTQ